MPVEQGKKVGAAVILIHRRSTFHYMGQRHGVGNYAAHRRADSRQHDYRAIALNAGDSCGISGLWHKAARTRHRG